MLPAAALLLLLLLLLPALRLIDADDDEEEEAFVSTALDGGRLKSSSDFIQLYDFREFRLAQRIDVDCGIESIDGEIVLFELKSDKWISEQGNLFFETQI